MSFYSNRNRGVTYIGSKGKCGEIVRIVNDLLPPGGAYWEPFCGACKVLQGVRTGGCRYGTDTDPEIIRLLRAVQDGWQPPTRVTEDDYKLWKKAWKKGVADPMVGFVGYACSFGGRFFEGYARVKKRNVNRAASARRSLLRQKPFLAGAVLSVGDYRNGVGRVADLIYCDPPYAGTKPCGSAGTPFDSAAFWEWAVGRSKRSIVLVSEYACPVKQAVCVWQKSVAAGIRFGTGGDGGARGDGRRKLEKLFLLNPEVRQDIGFGV